MSIKIRLAVSMMNQFHVFRQRLIQRWLEAAMIPKLRVSYKIVGQRSLCMGTYIEMAYCEKWDPKFEKFYFSKRILERYPTGHPNKNANGTIWGKKVIEEGIESIHFLPGVDDARLFTYNTKIYMYQQRYDSKINDCHISILDLESGQQSELYSPTGFNGKNWIPLTLDGNLYFIYSIDPLFILKAEEKQQKFLIAASAPSSVFGELRWGDGEKVFSSIRGGTPFEKVSVDFQIAFTHITPEGALKTSHRIGALLLAKNGELRHLLLSKWVFPSHLFDPYGISSKIDTDSQIIQIWISSVMGDIHNLYGVSKSFLLEFDVTTLISQIMKDGQLIRGEVLPF
jgi:hypothetical protein